MSFIDTALTKARQAQAAALPPQGWREAVICRARVQSGAKSKAIILTAVLPDHPSPVDFRLMYDCDTAAGLAVRDLEVLLAISTTLSAFGETPEGLCAAIAMSGGSLEVLIGHERDALGQPRATLRGARIVRTAGSQLIIDAPQTGDRP